MENSFEDLEETTEETTDTLPIEKAKKPHGSKGKAMTDYQKANLAKGREIKANNAAERKLTKAKELLAGAPPPARPPALVRQETAGVKPPSIVPEPKPRKKKQVIVIQSESDSDEEDQIIIRRKHKKSIPQIPQIPKEVPAPVMMALPDYSSSDDEPPAAPAVALKPKIIFRRY